jgi:oligopeptide transport system ATP-binding protein
MSTTDPTHGQHLQEEVAEGEHLMAAQNVKKYFPVKKGMLNREVARVHAVDDVTIAVKEGETLGLVGESGCGKSTFGRCLVRLLEPTAGKIDFQGRDITHLGARELRPLRRQMQIIFQDPYASLNPRKRVGSIIADPLRIHDMGSSKERKSQVQELMEKVGLQPEHYNRFPHEFSGGQRQRIGVARALALQPKLIVADEPVSALDVSIQAQIVNLLDDLQGEFKLTYIFIAHDLGVVRHVSDRIAVMYLGKVVELSPAEELYTRPIHPYTEAMLSAVPIPDPDVTEQRERIILEGDVPNPISPPPACRFHPRCRYATDVCRQVEPPLVDYGGGHYAACHHPRNVTEAMIATALHDGAEVQEPSGTANVLGGAVTDGDGDGNGAGRILPAAERPGEGRGADVPGGIGSEADPLKGDERGARTNPDE